MTDKITPQAFGLLFEIHVRGVLASMFMSRRIDPTREQWDKLVGNDEISMRDIGEISSELGIHTTLVLEALGISEAEND